MLYYCAIKSAVPAELLLWRKAISENHIQAKAFKLKFKFGIVESCVESLLSIYNNIVIKTKRNDLEFNDTALQSKLPNWSQYDASNYK